LKESGKIAKFQEIAEQGDKWSFFSIGESRINEIQRKNDEFYKYRVLPSYAQAFFKETSQPS
jgi:hypothetical protein